MTALLTMMGVSIADEADQPPADDCRPVAQTTAIEGQDPSGFTAPDGFTDHASISIAVAVSHDGTSCSQALNSPPQLLAPWATPVWGPANEWVSYHVRYLDADGDPPAYIRVIVDNDTVIDLRRSPGSGQDYAAGVNFEGSPQTPLQMGLHSYRFIAADAFEETTSPLLLGPRIIDLVFGAVDQANPANRMVIHPIANGPTLVPATEIPPTLLPVVGNPLHGIVSYTFDVDPEAANGRAEAVVTGSAGGVPLRDGGFEEPVGGPYGNRLLGSAAITEASRSGNVAVELAPSGAIPDAVGRVAGIDLALLAHHPMAQWDRFEFWSQYDAGDGNALAEQGSLRLLFDLDLDYDGDGDACLAHETMPRVATEWTLHEVTLTDSFAIYDAPCGAPRLGTGPIDGPKPLRELQDNPVWGRARLTRVILETRAIGAAPGPLTGGHSLVVDDLFFLARGTSDADFDACYYPAAPATAPISCVSDIGPHDGPLPAGTRRVNVWADTLLPSGFVFEHPYIEPATFLFHYLERGRAPAPAILEPRSVGSVIVVEDTNSNYEADIGEPILARRDGIVPTIAEKMLYVQVPLDPGSDGAARTDGPIPLLVVYDNGLPANRPGLSSTLTAERLEIQWFENDLPSAAIDASQRRPLARKVDFVVTAGDPDNSQGFVAQRLGGLHSWTLDFGDGTPLLEGTTQTAVASHKYVRGSYTATLTVADASNANSTSAIQLDVLMDPNELGVPSVDENA